MVLFRVRCFRCGPPGSPAPRRESERSSRVILPGSRMLPSGLSVLLLTAVGALLGALGALGRSRDAYSFRAVNSRGKLVSLEKYRGSVSLFVNVASECGYTDEHYRELQQLQRDFGPAHFNVLAFPCNQFGAQEPGSDRDIDAFVRRVYGVTFPIFSKIAVVGTGANNIYKFLAESSGSEPDWNFWKFLVDGDGQVVDAWGPKVPVNQLRQHVAQMVRQIILKKKKKDEL